MPLWTYSHAIPAMQEEAAMLIAGLVFSGSQAVVRNETGLPTRV